MKLGDPDYMLWHADDCWYVNGTNVMGVDAGWISIKDDCISPNKATGLWRVLDDDKDNWVDAPEIRCLAGDALESALAAAAPRVTLAGPTPEGLHAEWCGVFVKRKALVHGYPSYEKRGDPDVMMWQADSCWWVGAADEAGGEAGCIVISSGALSPEGATGKWNVLNVLKGSRWLDAPELKCTAGEDEKLVEKGKKARPHHPNMGTSRI